MLANRVGTGFEQSLCHRRSEDHHLLTAFAVFLGQEGAAGQWPWPLVGRGGSRPGLGANPSLFGYGSPPNGKRTLNRKVRRRHVREFRPDRVSVSRRELNGNVLIRRPKRMDPDSVGLEGLQDPTLDPLGET